MSDSLPQLSKLSNQLAEDNLLVAKFIESLSNRIDLLVSAACEENWEEVYRVCQYICHSSQAFGYPEIAQKAEEVCQGIEKSEVHGQTQTKRSLIKLISAYGKIGRKSASA